MTFCKIEIITWKSRWIWKDTSPIGNKGDLNMTIVDKTHYRYFKAVELFISRLLP